MGSDKLIKLECLKLAIQLHPGADDEKILKAAESTYILISTEWPNAESLKLQPS